MPIGKSVILSAKIGGGKYYPTPTNQQASVQVSGFPVTWTVSAYEGGMVLSVNGQYLSSKTVNLPYKNSCQIMTSDINEAAVVMPYYDGASGVCYLNLLGTTKYLDLDTRGYVTLFNPLQPNNGYPYFQYLNYETIASDENDASDSDFLEKK